MFKAGNKTSSGFTQLEPVNCHVKRSRRDRYRTDVDYVSHERSGSCENQKKVNLICPTKVSESDALTLQLEVQVASGKPMALQ